MNNFLLEDEGALTVARIQQLASILPTSTNIKLLAISRKSTYGLFSSVECLYFFGNELVTLVYVVGRLHALHMCIDTMVS